MSASALDYRDLFEAAPLPMWVYDVATRQVLAVNDAALRCYGYSRDEFLRLSLDDLQPTGEHTASVRHITRSGAPITVELTAQDVNLDGRAARIVVARDITERLRLEAHDQQVQSIDAIARLAGGIAHDFNNILSVILSYSDSLLAMIESGELHDDVQQIHNAGNRGAALTRQLLMFNRLQLIEPRTLDLNELLDGMTDVLRRLLQSDIELVSRPEPTLGQVRADQASMEQLIMNLVVNAREAMASGGLLTLATGNVALDPAEARERGVPAGRYIMLAIGDTGTGMDAATRARMFEPFFTTKPRGRGAGLGLSTVFGIVQQHGGHIRVDSEPGRGTAFRVYLPRIDQVADPVVRPRVVRRRETLNGSETILLVEPDEQVRGAAVAILRSHGYPVVEATDGDSAERACAAHPDRIDLLLTEVALAGITGPELAGRLQHRHPALKVLCMSGYTGEVSVGYRGPDTEMAYLQKPFTPEALASHVRRVLDGGVPDPSPSSATR